MPNNRFSPRGLLIAGSFVLDKDCNMIKALSACLSGLILIAALPAAQAEPACKQSEIACVLQAAWGAALVLPEEKQRRLQPLFLELAAHSGDAELLQTWQTRWPDMTLDAATYPDFGWEKARKIVETEGVDTLIRFAREKRAPLNFGRSDILLSAGKRMIADQPGEAAKLNAALLELAASASDFEQPELANAAAELSMYRCDAAQFDKAMRLARDPRNLRYGFWQARLSGDLDGLLSRVREEADDSDTRHVRRALDGYRAIVELGYCAAKTGNGDA